MSSDANNFHLFFLPLMAHGHLIPAVDMARIFASRGAKVTIVTTPRYGQFLSQKVIQKTKGLGFQMDVLTIRFPATDVGLPEGCENLDFISADNTRGFTTVMEMTNKFCQAMELLQEPVEMLLQEFRPNALVADALFPWATDAAAKLGIPRLVFHGTCFFSLCVSSQLRLCKPDINFSSDSESFIVPKLPGDVKLAKKHMPQAPKEEHQSAFAKVFREAWEAEMKSYGVVVNSFYELEPTYADHYRRDLGRKSWHIGPVSLYNKDLEDKSRRGKDALVDGHECLKWLNSKKPKSVVYVCFGSLVNFQASQLKELAMGLEASGHQFIWVVRKNETDQLEDKEDWIPEGFKERIEGKGLIVRGWAPQLLILDHEAVGGFVTHCGWNSILEGVTAGQPMVTWPVMAEQFFNEILVTQILKIGISVGAADKGDNDISSEVIKEAVTVLMNGEEAEEMRSKAMDLGEKARRAVEEGGSSHSDLTALLEELRLQHH